MPTRLPALLTLPLLLMLGGCPVWGSGNDPHECGPGTDCYSGCLADGDCSVGYYCEESSGACVMTPTCINDATCGAGRICDFRGSCVPQTPNGCRTDVDCTGGKVCVEGSCHVPGLGTCQFDLECGAGRICVDGGCTNTCTGSGGSQCGSGQTCTGGHCVPTQNECTTSDDCSGGKSCLNGRCLPPCSGSGTCPNANDLCDTDGFCHPNYQQSGFCDADNDCAAGSTCDVPNGICRIACGPSSSLVTEYNMHPNPGCSADVADCACQTADAQFPTCGLPSGPDDFCRTSAEGVSDCAIASDCTVPGEHCVNGSCQ